jgi:hypothetical protein
MMQFIAQLRELSGGKPVGFKFCLGHPWEFMGIAKAMLETGILPTSSWSMARKAAPAPRRWSSPTISACRCAKACCSCTTPWWA